jgi:hypothetical protein
MLIIDMDADKKDTTNQHDALVTEMISSNCIRLINVQTEEEALVWKESEGLNAEVLRNLLPDCTLEWADPVSAEELPCLFRCEEDAPLKRPSDVIMTHLPDFEIIESRETIWVSPLAVPMTLVDATQVEELDSNIGLGDLVFDLAPFDLDLVFDLCFPSSASSSASSSGSSTLTSAKSASPDASPAAMAPSTPKPENQRKGIRAPSTPEDPLATVSGDESQAPLRHPYDSPVSTASSSSVQCILTPVHQGDRQEDEDMEVPHVGSAVQARLQESPM